MQDGNTGWGTMYALIRALQIELGITTLSDNFGPTTMSRFSSQIGSVSASTTNLNVLRIAQGGLWCKGYHGGFYRGLWDTDVAAGIGFMTADMGFASVQYISPKVMRGLLTMDAYVLLPGGTASRRAAQQWLNQRYSNRADFIIMPCDGLFSRNTQIGLMYGIQYEAGMVDGVANGNFGPGTKSALQTQATVSLGMSDSTKNWVHLFQAALRFNDYASPLSGTFDSATRDAVLDFQGYAELPTTGSGNYQTWASLLVSTGDETRAGIASDMSTQLSAAHCGLLYSNGYRTVGRYLTESSKRYLPGELGRIFAAGLKTFPIMQEANTSIGDFTYEKGQDHGRQAAKRLRQLGFRANTMVFFAVDFDATDDAITAAVLPYFQGVNDYLGRSSVPYRVGIYGTRNVCTRVISHELAHEAFIASMSWGWSGNLGFKLPPNWSYDQIQGKTLSGGGTSLEIDKNIQSTRATPVSASGIETTPLPLDSAGNPTYDDLYWMIVHVQVLAELLHPLATARWQDLAVLQYLQTQEIAYTQIQFALYCFGPAGQTADWDCYVLLPAQAASAESDLEQTRFIEKYAVADGVPAGTSHFAVTARGYAQWGTPENFDKVAVSDLGGWALDLATLWEDYARLTPAPRPSGSSSAREFFDARLGIKSPSDHDRFSFDDLVGDIDGFLVGSRLANNPALRLQDAVRQVRVSIVGDPRWRFSTFFQERFGSSISNARAAALDMFVSGNLAVSGSVALTIGGVTLSTGVMGNGLVAPSNDEKTALAEAWAYRLADLAANGPTRAPA